MSFFSCSTFNPLFVTPYVRIQTRHQYFTVLIVIIKTLVPVMDHWHVMGQFVSFRLVEHFGSSSAGLTSFYGTFKPLRAKGFADNTNSENSHRAMQFCIMVTTADIRIWTQRKINLFAHALSMTRLMSCVNYQWDKYRRWCHSSVRRSACIPFTR